MYLVSIHYRGILNVDQMRCFTELAEAQEYAREIFGEDRYPPDFRVYKLSADAEPVLLHSLSKNGKRRGNGSYYLEFDD